MDNPLFFWGAILMMALIAVGYGLGLKPREGPTPLSEVFGIAGIAAVGAVALGWYLALIPIGIAVLMMLLGRRG